MPSRSPCHGPDDAQPGAMAAQALGMTATSPAARYIELPLESLAATPVEAVWCYEPDTTGKQLVLPDGRMDLVAHCTVQPDGKLRSVWLVVAGPADRPTLVDIRPDTVVVGVRFHIGWGGVCLGVDPTGLCNRTISGRGVAQLLGPLAEQILRASTVGEAQAALRSVASTLALRPHLGGAHKRALGAIERMKAQAQTGAAWKDAWTESSARTLRRDVVAMAGLPLRSLAGILRFQQAMALLDAGAASLSDVAAAAGYSDQAHMTRAFRRFGGFTPAIPEPAPLVALATPRH